MAFLIRRPDKTHRTFAVYLRDCQTGKRKRIHDTRIDQINIAYRSGVLSFERAIEQLEEFRRIHLKHDFGINSLPENETILQNYWNKFYARKPLRDPFAAKCRLKRAIAALGILSLRVASEMDIQKAADVAPDQRRVVAALKQLLKFIGRSDVILHPARKSRNKVSYLTLSELKQVLPYLPSNEIRAICAFAFVSGLRQGEAFGVSLSSFRDLPTPSVFVSGQITRKGEDADTKTSATRRAPLIVSDQLLYNLAINWIELPLAEKLTLRKAKFAEIVRRSVKKANIGKNVCFHDLRHSYAIHCLSRGASITEVALALGNSVTVCQSYYTGFELSDDGLRRLGEKLR